MEDFKFDNPGINPNLWKSKIYVAISKSFINQPFPMSYMFHVLFTVLGYTVD